MSRVYYTFVVYTKNNLKTTQFIHNFGVFSCCRYVYLSKTSIIINMDLFITSERGKLVQNGEIISPPLFKPKKKYEEGDLTTAASLINIHGVCESMLELFIRPMGITLDKSKNWERFKMDVATKYTNGSCPPVRNENNLTRGWCYLASGVLHRFFWKNYDLYKVSCPLDEAKRDYHWWLESKCRNYVIDLTEEQYLKVGIKNIREGGSLVQQMGHSYGVKTRNMAYIVATNLFPTAVNLWEMEFRKYNQIKQV